MKCSSTHVSGDVYQVVKRRWPVLDALKWRAFEGILPCCFCFSAKWAIQALHLLKSPRLFQGSILGPSLPAVCSLCLLLPLSWGTAPPSGPPACGGWGTGRGAELFLPLTRVTQWKEQKGMYLYRYLSLCTYIHIHRLIMWVCACICLWIHTPSARISLYVYIHSIYSICSFFLQHTYAAGNNYCEKKYILTKDKFSSRINNVWNSAVRTLLMCCLPLLKHAHAPSENIQHFIVHEYENISFS